MKDWKKVTLGDICTRITDGSHNPPRAIETSKFLMISSKNIGNDQIIFDEPRYLSEKDFWIENKRTEIAPGDILLTIVGSIGRVAVVPKDASPFTVQRSVAVLKPNSGLVASRFLMYLLQNASELLTAGARGVAQKGIYLGALRDLEFLLPPLPEQQRIVAILDEAFVGLMTASANVKKNLRNARALFDSYLSFVFEQEWEKRALGDICENLDSRRIPVTKKDRKAGSIPYYGASGAVDHVADFIFDEDLLLVSEDGANLVMRTYPIAFSISGKSWVNNHAHVLRFVNFASQKFVEYYLNSISLMPYVNGMAQPKLNQKALNSIAVPFPPLDDQERAVARLRELAAQTDRLRETYEGRIAALAELKQSILQKSFSGELTSPPSSAVREAAE